MKKGIVRLASLMLCVMMVVGSASLDVDAATKRNYHEWLESCQKVAKQLDTYKFRFNKYGTKSKAYKKVRKKSKSKRVANCHDYLSWSLQEFGTLKSGDYVWTELKSVKGRSRKRLNKNVKKIYPKGQPRARTLAKKGILKPGDIISQAGGSSHHSEIYAGLDSKGNPILYAVGKAYQTGKGGYFVSTKILSSQHDKRRQHHNPKVAMILRLKNLDYTDYYKITTSATNGTITKTNTKAYWGKNYTIKYSPNEGYKLSKVYLNGKAVSTKTYANSITIKKIKKNQNVKVVFERIVNNVNVTVHQDGIDDQTTSTKVNYGDEYTYTPEDGMIVDKITVDGVDKTADYTVAERKSGVKVVIKSNASIDITVRSTTEDDVDPSAEEDNAEAEGADAATTQETVTDSEETSVTSNEEEQLSESPGNTEESASENETDAATSESEPVTDDAPNEG